jgi:pyruvate/2-oxoglutarate dehydrogenase complex dihydrolipoamide dehydrogenase (E3) component
VAAFDVVVVGSGSGGRAAAGRLADAGMRVAMAERELVGGECPYWACMPSKALLRPPEAVAAARRVPGVRAGISDWEEVAAFRDEVVSGRDDAAKARRYAERGVTILRGHGRLDGPGAVVVGDERHTVHRIVLATGSEAIVPPIEGLESVGAWTNREAMEMRSVPASALVLGAGPVGVEIGQMLARYGARVAIADSSPRPLPDEAPEVGALLSRRLTAEGIAVMTGREAVRVDPDGDGCRVTFDDGSELGAERIVIATGRRPRVEGIGLETVGIAHDETGVEVDGRCRAAEGVWAVGDLTGVGQFTHVASYQGRIAALDVLGEPVEADYSAVPRSVFCDPEVAAVGMTPEGARAAGLDVAVATVDLADLERSSTYGTGVEGLIGVVADRRAGTLVGAYAVGPLASEWIHLAVVAVRARVPVDTLRDLIAQFPSFAEGLVTAARALDMGRGA